MKLIRTLTATLLALALFASQAQAHRLWIKPNTTVVSGENEWITFDAAIANGIFNPDHHAYPLERLTAWNPEANKIELQNGQRLKYRSVFDLNLTAEGTYKVFSASRTLVARWTDENGERHFWPGRGRTGTEEEFRSQVPQGAADLQVTDVANRIEVFVTAGAPTDAVLKPIGQGLEWAPELHPNDLYTGEAVTFGFLFDGQPAKNASLILVREGEKYRDQSQPIIGTTNGKGEVTVTFDAPGMYFLEVEYEDDNAEPPASQRRGSYSAVVEVLPL